jgi:hypothetical protein
LFKPTKNVPDSVEKRGPVLLYVPYRRMIWEKQEREMAEDRRVWPNGCGSLEKAPKGGVKR